MLRDNRVQNDLSSRLMKENLKFKFILPAFLCGMKRETSLQGNELD